MVGPEKQESEEGWRERLINEGAELAADLQLGATKGDRKNAKLAYLLDLVVNDPDFEHLHNPLKRLAASREAMREDYLSLARLAAPHAKELNLHPLVLAVMLMTWGSEADLGGKGAEGLEDWFDLSDNVRDERAKALAEVRQIVDELAYSLERLNEDPEIAVELARRKSVALTKRLQSLRNKIRGERSKHTRVFHELAKRDIEAFYRWEVKRSGPADRSFLEPFNEMGLDLSIAQNLRRVRKYAQDRAGVLRRLMRTLFDGEDVLDEFGQD